MQRAGFGPQLHIARLQAECFRALIHGRVDPDFRHYLNQFALWADASEILALASALAERQDQILKRAADQADRDPGDSSSDER